MYLVVFCRRIADAVKEKRATFKGPSRQERRAKAKDKQSTNTITLGGKKKTPSTDGFGSTKGAKSKTDLLEEGLPTPAQIESSGKKGSLLEMVTVCPAHFIFIFCLRSCIRPSDREREGSSGGKALLHTATACPQHPLLLHIACACVHASEIAGIILHEGRAFGYGEDLFG